MAGSAWKSQGKQRTDAATRSAEAQRKTKTAVPPGQSLLVQALLAGVSPDYLPALLGQGGEGIPNSLLLDLLDQQSGFREMPFRSLPENGPDTAPFVWFGPMESPETGAANTLPAPAGMTGAANVPPVGMTTGVGT